MRVQIYGNMNCKGSCRYHCAPGGKQGLQGCEGGMKGWGGGALSKCLNKRVIFTVNHGRSSLEDYKKSRRPRARLRCSMQNVLG